MTICSRYATQFPRFRWLNQPFTKGRPDWRLWCREIVRMLKYLVYHYS
jgi:hypothetical protein